MSTEEQTPDGNQGGGDASPRPGATQGAGGSAVQRIMGHMSANKIDAALWGTRVLTVFFFISYFIPVFGNNPYSSYQKALLSNAATSALRLHQRLPNFQLNREFFGRLMLEDSAHYLFYSLIFVTGHPVTMVPIPVFAYALLHAQKYTQQLLNAIGPGSVGWLRGLLSKLDNNQVNILRFIACNEIFLMPALVFMIFTGHSSLLLPFIYYRFLTLRYSSRRNPYCRQIFYELRLATESLCSSPKCPGMVRNICYKVISFVSRLAPQVPAA